MSVVFRIACHAGPGGSVCNTAYQIVTFLQVGQYPFSMIIWTHSYTSALGRTFTAQS